MTRTIIEALYREAERRPEAPALLGPKVSVSFGELLERVGRAGALLRQVGVEGGQAVGVCSDNRVECLVAMYAIGSLGCTFVPLSPREPARRLEDLARRAALSTVFTEAGRRLAGVRSHLDLAGLLGASDVGSVRTLQEMDGAASDEAATAYIIFTSGSTGEPKGVRVSHAAFLHAVEAAAASMAFDGSTRSLTVLPLHFDGTFSSVFPVLLRGGSVFVAPGPVCPPSRFVRYMVEHSVTHTTLTPSYLRAVLEEVGPDVARCSTWRTLALGGEAPAKSQLLKLREYLPNLRLFNRYGPTEATMAVSTLEITSSMIESDAPIPIGTPNPGVTFSARVGGRGIQPGEQAELWIGGAQLMQGYLGDEAGTRAVMGRIDGHRALRTGDIVTRDGSGNYVFVERVDNVIKRNGTRIALSEIEAALDTIPSVEAAVCVKIAMGEEVRIVAVVQSATPALGERELRHQLLELLPPAMLPDQCMFVSELPRVGAGKLDRDAVKRLAVEMGVN